MRLAAQKGSTRRRAFTLAEVAVTIAVVGLALVWMLQALNTAKFTALDTRNRKLARELALLTLGQVESGLFVEDLDDDRMEGTYAEEGYQDFHFEVVIGDQVLRPDENSAAFDNWLEEQIQREDEQDEEAEQAYEKVQVRVTWPQLLDLKSELILERWLPWEQLHPSEEEQEQAEGAAGPPGGTG